MEGSVDDFTPQVQVALRQQVATLLDVPLDTVFLTLEAGSVTLTFRIAMDTASAVPAATGVLAGALDTPQDASATLSVPGLTLNVTAIPIAPAAQWLSSAMPPARPPASPAADPDGSSQQSDSESPDGESPDGELLDGETDEASALTTEEGADGTGNTLAYATIGIVAAGVAIAAYVRKQRGRLRAQPAAHKRPAVEDAADPEQLTSLSSSDLLISTPRSARDTDEHGDRDVEKDRPPSSRRSARGLTPRPESAVTSVPQAAKSLSASISGPASQKRVPSAFHLDVSSVRQSTIFDALQMDSVRQSFQLSSPTTSTTSSVLSPHETDQCERL